MPLPTTLEMVGGLRIVVPDSLDLITPYVVHEQLDWFETEIKFLRLLLKPGQNVIDIGANYGVYTLSMAQAVGATGRVWAFEPALSTARLLADGVAANGFSQVVVERSAVSCTAGTAQLSLNNNSELNALVHGMPSAMASETVDLVTLDGCLERNGWQDIDLVKIDAEGEEANILKGGERFFRELSPLVQYEVKAGKELHMGLVRDFAALGYDSFRLIPGLDLLAPFDAASVPDGYLLNLFCCKPDRAQRLAEQGWLVESAHRLPEAETSGLMGIAEVAKISPAFDWRNTIAKLPYGAQLASRWEQTMSAGGNEEVAAAISLYMASQHSTLAPAVRLGALEASFNILNKLCERQPSHLRLASLARVAQDYGARASAVSALRQVHDTIARDQRVDPSEPFLAPGKRFDSIAPKGSFGNWVLAASLEEYERLGSFSSFYTGVSAQKRLEFILGLGYASPEMERRLRLLQKRFGLPAA